MQMRRKNLNDSDYRIRMMDLPHGVKAVVSMDEEGFANIYVNARLSHDEQIAAARHEIMHVVREDAYNRDAIEEVERER